jgi:hypothetical protein
MAWTSDEQCGLAREWHRDEQYGLAMAWHSHVKQRLAMAWYREAASRIEMRWNSLAVRCRGMALVCNVTAMRRDDGPRTAVAK